MSTDSAASPASWPVLSQIERRLLGVLVEKAKMTPDTYPLSLNSLTTGSNQKSARDPVMNVSEEDVLEALSVLQGKGLITRIQGGRVERYRHNLYDVWDVEKVELAVLAELLLRGPQTEGELRGRASRMEPIDDLDALRIALKPLGERKLVVFLGPEGKRGSLITHGFHDAKELDVLRLKQRAQEMAAPVESTAPVRSERGAGYDAPIAEVRGEVAALRKLVDDLQTDVRRLNEELNQLKSSLGA